MVTSVTGARGFVVDGITVDASGVNNFPAGITVGMLLALTRTRPQGEFADIFKRGR